MILAVITLSSIISAILATVIANRSHAKYVRQLRDDFNLIKGKAEQNAFELGYIRGYAQLKRRAEEREEARNIYQSANV